MTLSITMIKMQLSIIAQLIEVVSTECCFTEFQLCRVSLLSYYTECHYAECRHTECRGTLS